MNRQLEEMRVELGDVTDIIRFLNGDPEPGPFGDDEGYPEEDEVIDFEDEDYDGPHDYK
jgi:hypothetical protein